MRHDEARVTGSAFVQPAASIACSICGSSPRNARFTGSPSSPSLVRARPMK